MIDAKKLGELFRTYQELTIPFLIQQVDGAEDLTFVLQGLVHAGIIVQIYKEGMPYQLTSFGKQFMGVE